MYYSSTEIAFRLLARQPTVTQISGNINNQLLQQMSMWLSAKYWQISVLEISQQI